MRRSKEEIFELFRACQTKLGRTPGIASFCKATGVKRSEVDYYWPRPSALVEEVGGRPNEFVSRLSNDEVFADYARVCLKWRKIPTEKELRIAQRELKTRTHSVKSREGTTRAFQEKFRAWLTTSPHVELQEILEFEGWPREKGEIVSIRTSEVAKGEPHLHPFLPGCLQYLEVLARGEIPPFEWQDVSVSLLFERRVSDAFRCLGLEIRQLGQGTGRNADTIACAPRERFALIIDAKVRVNGYVLGTEDRKFLEYAIKHGEELQGQGIEQLYLVVVGPSFRETDLKKLSDYLSKSPIRSVVLLSARALLRIVEDSIRERSQYSLADLSKQFFGNKIISA